MLTWLAALAGCAPVLRTGGIIDRYNQGECVALQRTRNGTLEALLLNNTARVEVIGGFSGHVNVAYLDDGKVVTAAKVGDYFRIIDVRTDPASNVLQIRSAGCRPAFGGCGTTLFEFDLKNRDRLERKRVDAVLVAECPRPSLP
jgi:hypothetical protein